MFQVLPGAVLVFDPWPSMVGAGFSVYQKIHEKLSPQKTALKR